MASQVSQVLRMDLAVTVGIVDKTLLIAGSSVAGLLHASVLQLSSGPVEAVVDAVDQHAVEADAAHWLAEPTVVACLVLEVGGLMGFVDVDNLLVKQVSAGFECCLLAKESVFSFGGHEQQLLTLMLFWVAMMLVVGVEGIE